jgi:streptomycin 6-kinase
VLKIVKRPGDEWRSGAVLAAFDGKGIVRAHEHVAGAIMMERLTPGHSLVDLAISDRDTEATHVIAGVIHAMRTAARAWPNECPTVHDWGEAFARYVTTGDQSIPGDLVFQAHRVYDELCQSQSDVRLLHGDLQHSNVLFDEQRGWVAIDPKGVIGEIEYEVGAAMRNPRESPSLFTSQATVERRIRQLSETLELDATRALRWTFAQAVLSAIWTIEDNGRLSANEPTLALAETIGRML